MSAFSNPTKLYAVIVNEEGQHSLWLAEKPIPRGWRLQMGPDSRETCLQYVDSNWTDMRPLSLQRNSTRKAT
ncbi:MbtH family protein [Allorhizobium ampelinum]|uniref:MbtH family protein n=1 Tax=Allorhizobium ampelinum TaxID=3025782 RepID=UPI0009B61755|nr:MbtH family NRPS accessory protein [Allorhizobium ampelinum]